MKSIFLGEKLKNFFGAVAVFSDFFCVFCFINFYVFLNF